MIFLLYVIKKKKKLLKSCKKIKEFLIKILFCFDIFYFISI